MRPSLLRGSSQGRLHRAEGPGQSADSISGFEFPSGHSPRAAPRLFISAGSRAGAVPLQAAASPGGMSCAPPVPVGTGPRACQVHWADTSAGILGMHPAPGYPYPRDLSYPSPCLCVKSTCLSSLTRMLFLDLLYILSPLAVGRFPSRAKPKGRLFAWRKEL